MRPVGVRTGKPSGISGTAAGGTLRPLPGVMVPASGLPSQSGQMTC